MPVGASPANFQGADATALRELREQIGWQTFAERPQETIDRLQAFAEGRELAPMQQAEVTLHIAEIMRRQLDQSDAALQRLQAAARDAVAKPVAQLPVELMYLSGQAATLMEADKAPAALALLKANFKMVTAGATVGSADFERYSSWALFYQCAAQDAVRAPNAAHGDNIELLEYVLGQWPVYLDGGAQVAPDWKQGWMYEKLVAAAQSAPVAGVKTDNPLDEVALPEFNDKSRVAAVLKGKQQVQSQWPARWRVSGVVTKQIALGRWRGAMEDALDLTVEDASLPDGPQEVARVFKAHDGSVARANAFLVYTGGQGQNPVPQFLAEVDAQAKTAPVAAPKARSEAAQGGTP